jgi:hypothetical protein
MHLRIESGGLVTCLYAEMIDLTALGEVSIQRASHVEPDQSSHWWADLALSNGPLLGPFALRSEALNAESAWLDRFKLGIAGE